LIRAGYVEGVLAVEGLIPDWISVLQFLHLVAIDIVGGFGLFGF